MPLAPALLVLFGTTGDLARKKLYPALHALHQSGRLAPETAIIGVGRRDWDDAIYRDTIAAAIRAADPVTQQELSSFTDRFF